MLKQAQAYLQFMETLQALKEGQKAMLCLPFGNFTFERTPLPNNNSIIYEDEFDEEAFLREET